MTIGERIKERRKELGISVDDLAHKIGKNRATIYRYESKEIENLPTTVLEPLAKALATTPAALMGWDESSAAPQEAPAPRVSDHRKIARIPVLGRVAAGIPIEAVQDIEDYEDIPASWGDPREYFALKIQGHSMEPRIWDGDTVIVQKLSDADSDSVAVVLVDGEEATVKQIKKSEDGMTLIGWNPAVYPPKFYTWAEVSRLPVQILGIVKEVRGKIT